MINKLKPEHFDLLGVITFLFITIYAGYSLFTGKLPSQGYTIALLVIGVGGMIIDDTIVYKYILKRDKQL